MKDADDTGSQSLCREGGKANEDVSTVNVSKTLGAGRMLRHVGTPESTPPLQTAPWLERGTFPGYQLCHGDGEAPRTGLARTGPRERGRPVCNSCTIPAASHPGAEHGPSGPTRVPVAGLGQGARVTPWEPCPPPPPTSVPGGLASGRPFPSRRAWVNSPQGASLAVSAAVHGGADWVPRAARRARSCAGCAKQTAMEPMRPRGGEGAESPPPGCSLLPRQSLQRDGVHTTVPSPGRSLPLSLSGQSPNPPPPGLELWLGPSGNSATQLPQGAFRSSPAPRTPPLLSGQETLRLHAQRGPGEDARGHRYSGLAPFPWLPQENKRRSLAPRKQCHSNMQTSEALGRGLLPVSHGHSRRRQTPGARWGAAPTPRQSGEKGVPPHSPHTDEAPARLSPWKGLQWAGVLGATRGVPVCLVPPPP